MMIYEKTRTFVTRCLLGLAVTVGVFSFFSGCTSAWTRDATPTTVHQTILTAPSMADGMIASASSIPFSDIEGVTAPQPSASAADWSDWYDATYGENASQVLCFTEEEIAAANQYIAEHCDKVVDLTDRDKVYDGTAVRAMMQSYAMPGGVLEDRGGVPVTEADREAILRNCGTDTLPDVIMPRSAVVVVRCDMKSFPTDRDFYVPGDRYYSQIQETELLYGTPLWILAESVDGNFVFVQAPNYAGWVASSAVTQTSWDYLAWYASPTAYVTVTATTHTIHGTRLDMSCILPYHAETEEEFIVTLVSPDGRRSLGHIPKTAAVYGSLPFTMENYYTEAFAYIGIPYGWGGADGGVDCSSFVATVMRVFGLRLPRNAGEQSLFSGDILSLEGKTTEEMDTMLASVRTPIALHRPGHVMLYLGKRDGVHRVIHAPRGGQAVSVMGLTLPDTLTIGAVLACFSQ